MTNLNQTEKSDKRYIGRDDIKDLIDKHENWLNMNKRERRKKANIGMRFAISKNDSIGFNSFNDVSNMVLDESTFENNTIHHTNISAIRFNKSNHVNMNYRNCDFDDVDMGYATFDNVRFSGSKFVGCNFYLCTFTDVDFTDCCFIKTAFNHCNFVNCTFNINNLFADSKFFRCDGLPRIPALSIVPSDGAFIGWKAVKDVISDKVVLCKLEIPASCSRINPIGTRKCRASGVKLLAFYTISGKKLRNKLIINYRFEKRTVYKIGKITRPDGLFDFNSESENSNGIYFFIDKDEAIAYAKYYFGLE